MGKLKNMAGPAASDPHDGDKTVPLDDIMIAMDVVDTLRHDARIVERELNEETRRAALIERLKKIYRDQGIEVPDHLLEEGVKALKDDRFVYTPPKDGLKLRLARLYVTRNQWGRWVIGALIGCLAVIAGWFLFYEMPRQNAAASRQIELTETLPALIKKTRREIGQEMVQGSKASPVLQRADRLAKDGLAAAQGGDLKAARAAAKDLSALLSELKRDFKVKIVSRRGELSGLWRIPKTNPKARNYYLVVEAVDDKGRAIPRRIFNEETRQFETVSKWAQRVPKRVLDKVQADKADDGIIQNDTIGVKRRGQLDINWLVRVHDGAITQWGAR